MAGIVAASLVASTGCTFALASRDISPNRPNAAVQAAASTSGLISELAGDDAAMYAVSLDAGVWKSVGGGAWSQLAGSPQWATNIAIDPADPTHLVVGERRGDALPASLDRTGLWESTDAGVTWQLTFSALQQPGCRATQSTAIMAVAFTPARTLLIGTACGVGRRPILAHTFDFSATPAGVIAVKSFAVSAMKLYEHDPLLWARAELQDGRTTILSSERDATIWASRPVPAIVGGFGIGRSLRGDDFTIAAFGETAILSFRPNAESDPSVWTAQDNFNALLYYMRDRGTFQVQSLKGMSGDGTGLGGRKRLRSYTFDFRMPIAVGSAIQVLYIGGQDLLGGTGINGDGTIAWARLGVSACAGCNSQDAIHPDLWDVHVTKALRTVRLATDGGVFRRETTGWVTHNDGLHTHHVHSLATFPVGGYPRVSYVVSDNSEWMRPETAFGSGFDVAAGNWFSYSATGDGSFTMGDTGYSAVAVISRNEDTTFITDFGTGMPANAGVAARQGFRPICSAGQNAGQCAGSFNPSTFQIIQSRAGEAARPLLDVAMLVPGPVTALRSGTVQPVAGPLGLARSSTGAPLLLRNEQWLANPDVNRSQYQGWELVASDVPAGAAALWISGGHAAPVYYVLSVTASGTALWRHDTGTPGWERLGAIGAAIQLPAGAPGPVFVNPFDPDHIVVRAADGIRIAQGNGRVGAATPFQLDHVLTALISESGVHALDRVFPGGCDVVHCTQAFPRALLGDVAFNRNAPAQTVVASPATGIFFATDAARRWLSFNDALPRPHTMVSAVTIDDTGAYAAFEGRGVWAFTQLSGAPRACYFERVNLGPDQFIALHDGTGAGLAAVTVEIRLVTNGVEAPPIAATTDATGVLTIAQATGKVVHLSYSGRGEATPPAIASCHTSLSR